MNLDGGLIGWGIAVSAPSPEERDRAGQKTRRAAMSVFERFLTM